MVRTDGVAAMAGDHLIGNVPEIVRGHADGTSQGMNRILVNLNHLLEIMD
jgi:hypothetical protein